MDLHRSGAQPAAVQREPARPSRAWCSGPIRPGTTETDLTVTGYNPTTNTLSLSGSFSPPSSGSALTLYNDAALVGSSNPDSEYALEGNQIIAAVTPGVHTVAVSTARCTPSNQGTSQLEHHGQRLQYFRIWGRERTRALSQRRPEYPNAPTTRFPTLPRTTVTGSAQSRPTGVTNLTISGNSVGPNISQRRRHRRPTTEPTTSSPTTRSTVPVGRPSWRSTTSTRPYPTTKSPIPTACTPPASLRSTATPTRRAHVQSQNVSVHQ